MSDSDSAAGRNIRHRRDHDPHHHDHDESTSSAAAAAATGGDEPPVESSSSNEKDDFHFVPYDPATSSYAIIRLLAEVSTLKEMLHAFGVYPLLTLALVYFLIKGISVTSLNLALLPVFRDGLQVHDSAEFQRFSVVAALAWGLKSLIGVTVDTFSFGGFRKRWYLTGATTVAVLLLLTICTVPRNPESVPLVTFLLFFTNFSLAAVDLLCEACYSRFYLLRPRAGTALVSLCWTLVMCSGIFAAPIVGPLSDRKMPFVAVFIVALLVSAAIMPFAKNWLGEMPLHAGAVVVREKEHMVVVEGGDNDYDDVDDDNHHETSAVAAPAAAAAVDVEMKETHPSDGKGEVSLDKQQTEEQAAETDTDADAAQTTRNLRKQALAMGILLPLVAVLSMVLFPKSQDGQTSNTTKKNLPNCSQQQVLAENATSIIGSHSEAAALAARKLVLPLCAAAALLATGYNFLPPVIFRANTYMFLNEALYISTAGALDFFFVASPECLPGGPNFSYTFYETTSTLISSAFGGLGAYLFHRYFSQRDFRYVFVLTTLLKIVASFFDVVIAERWNKSVLGLSDKTWFVFGESMILQVAYVLNFMCGVVLTAHLCPPGSEATVYALLAGFSNFGQSVSGLVGSTLTQAFGIRTKPVTARCFDDGGTLTNITKVLAPCDFSNLGLLVFVAHCLLPLLTLPLVGILVPKTRARTS